ncbi:MAG: hypothetical protein Q8O72_16635 [Bacteroidales bacterium]|nr:hypothetical protein [Bacteroidales bacterium]
MPTYNTKYLVLLLLFLLSTGKRGFAQTTFPPHLEEISLLTDRNLYLSGENIWYHIYYSLPSDPDYILSKVLYIELFNNELEVVASQKVEITNNLITGTILIPEQAETGYYLLRAYTKYDQNFPVWEMETSVLRIVNPNHPLIGIPNQEIDDQINMVARSGYSLEFYIEEPVSREIKNIELYSNGSKVNKEIVYYQNGLGRINYIPNEGDRLFLQMTLNKGDTLQSRKFTTKASLLHVETQYKSGDLDLNLSKIKYQDNNLTINILNIHSGIETMHFAQVNEQSAFIRIPGTIVGKGLLKISILDKHKALIDEFFYFLPEFEGTNKNSFSDTTATPGSVFTFDLKEMSTNYYPLSVSCVIRGTTNLTVNQLPNYLIDNPWYITHFIMGKEQLTPELIDQIQLAFSIKKGAILNQIKSITTTFVVPEIYGMNVEGKILDANNHQPLSDKLVYCALLGDQSQFHTTKTSQDGNFVFTLNHAFGTKDIFIGTPSTIESATSILVKNGFCPIPPLWNACYFSPDTSFEKLITQLYFNKQVNQLFDISKTNISQRKTPVRTLFGNPSNTIVLTDFVQLATTQEVFNELVPFVKVRKKEGHYKLIVLDETLKIEYDDPLVLVDQVPYDHIDEILKLQPTEIEKIEVISRVYVYGSQIFNGIIMITTSEGNLGGLPLDPSGIFAEYKTFEKESSFASFNNEVDNSNLPDFANTCYWNIIQESDSLPIQIKMPQSIANYNVMVTSIKKPVRAMKHQTIQIKKTLEK